MTLSRLPAPARELLFDTTLLDAERKATGAHYTPAVLGDFVARQMLANTAAGSGAPLRALDPAVGDGSLLSALLRRADGLAVEGYGYETNPDAVRLATAHLSIRFPGVPINIACHDFLDLVLYQYGNGGQGDLFSGQRPRFSDLVIANPPYVRTQVMGSHRAQALAARFGLSGRVDLYHAFILGIARVLRPGGIAGIIVSNRFMVTRAGAAVRAIVREEFEILHVWDLGDTKLFEAAVLPAVLLLRKKPVPVLVGEARFSTIYTTAEAGAATRVPTVIDALEHDGLVEVADGRRFAVRHGRLDAGGDGQGVWRLATDGTDAWLATVAAHTHCTFGDIGKIRVGVKTTADRVFIRTDWETLPAEEHPELLRPLTTHHVARRFKADPQIPQRQILSVNHESPVSGGSSTPARGPEKGSFVVY